MNPKTQKKGRKTKRPRTGGPARWSFALKEFSGVGLFRAMDMAQLGRAHDTDADGVAHALAGCLQYRQRQDFQEPDFADLKTRSRFSSGSIRHAESKEAAAPFEALAAQTVIEWLLRGAFENKRILPKRLRLLADLLESRPLQLDPGTSHQMILPAPAMPEVFAVLSLFWHAIPRPSGPVESGPAKTRHWTGREMQEMVARLPLKDRRACLDRYSPGLDDRRARKLMNQLWGIKFPKGAPKKTA